MDFDKKDGSGGYLDGVSLKISSAFLPPPPVVLPPLSTTEELDVQKYEYDFSLEKRVLETIHKMREKKKKKKAEPQNVLFSSDILLPQKRDDAEEVPPNSQNGAAQGINLSDFENDTSSPFDYMELQTINDLEELSSVFQGLNTSFEGENSSSVTKSMSFPLENGSSFDSPETTAQEDDVLLPKVPSVPIQDKPGLRVCKSYSDIHRLTSDVTMMPGRSATPPTIMDAPKTLSVQEEIADCDNSPVGLPDPYEELPEEDRRFVDAISDMGFKRAQVSRTVRHLGRDDKAVVDHLCQIQNLEERGYDCLEAEAALHLHDYDQEQAKKFLDLITKFEDLGFEKEAVKKALIQNKNDWSKTIDALLLS